MEVTDDHLIVVGQYLVPPILDRLLQEVVVTPGLITRVRDDIDMSRTLLLLIVVGAVHFPQVLAEEAEKVLQWIDPIHGLQGPGEQGWTRKGEGVLTLGHLPVQMDEPSLYQMNKKTHGHGLAQTTRKGVQSLHESLQGHGQNLIGNQGPRGAPLPRLVIATPLRPGIWTLVIHQTPQRSQPIQFMKQGMEKHNHMRRCSETPLVVIWKS